MRETSEKPDNASHLISLLVVDDDPEDFFILRRKLKSVKTKDYRITYTDSYAEAVDALNLSKFDAVLMDYYVGVHTGTEIFSAFEDKPHVPVIILSGNGSADIESEALDAGAFDYLNKSDVTPDNLVWVIDTAIYH